MSVTDAGAGDQTGFSGVSGASGVGGAGYPTLRAMRPSEGANAGPSTPFTFPFTSFRVSVRSLRMTDRFWCRRGAMVTQVIPRAVRSRPIQHRVELCNACLLRRVSRCRFRGPRSWPWRVCCGSVRRSRRRNPLQSPRRQRLVPIRTHPPPLRRCRMRTLQRVPVPFESRRQRPRRRRRLTGRLIRRAARRDWRGPHA